MTTRIKTTRFWLEWTFSSLLVYPITAILTVVFVIVWFPLMEMLTSTMYVYRQADLTMSDIFILLSVAVFGGAVSLSVGLLQARMVKRHFHIELQSWKRASAIGGAVATLAVLFTMVALDAHMNAYSWQLREFGGFQTMDTIMHIAPMTLYVSIMSVVQAFVLRRYVRDAWLWILANAVAGFMFSMVFVNAFSPSVWNWLLAAIAQGAITGFAMLWMLTRLTKDNQDDAADSSFAFQHVPIDVDDN